MQKRTRNGIIGGGAAVVLVGVGLGLGLTVPGPTSLTPSVVNDCSKNVTSELNSFFASVPAGSSVTLSGCYKVGGNLAITGLSNITIDGGGATIENPTAGTRGAGRHPLLFLAKDTNLSITNLNLTGAYNGTNGGVAVEGYLGIEAVSTRELSLNEVHVSNVQGDCLSYQFPSASIHVSGSELNHDATVTDSSFIGCGYTGLSVESVNGLSITGTTFENVQENAIDFEYDLYSSLIPAGTTQARGAAQDNITIDKDIFKKWGVDWFASLQGQTNCTYPYGQKNCVPTTGGVQQQNVKLTNNTLSHGHALIQVLGTDPADTTAPYLNDGLTITGNTSSTATGSTNGGAINGPKNVHFMATLENVENVDIENNTFPAYDGMPSYFPNTTYLGFLHTKNVTPVVVKTNMLPGASSVLTNGTHTATVTECGNTYGVDGKKSTAPC